MNPRSPKPPRSVREPIQVYLDGRDRALLDDLAHRNSVPRSEILRMGLRRLGSDAGPERSGSSIRELIGAIDGVDVPADLAARHDDYLYAAPKKAKRKASKGRKAR